MTSTTGAALATGRHRASPAPWRTIQDALDPRCNGLNLLRLILATGVIVYHSFRLLGRTIPAGPVEQALSQLWVDGFFVLSGFLIVGSWCRRPEIAPFVRNRFLRIYPGFFVCLVLTAWVFAPLGAHLGDDDLAVADQVHYIVTNAGLYIRDFGIGGTPTDVPESGAWNGSLWTLVWEALCYLAVLVAGVVGLLRLRHGVLAVFLGAWALALVTDVTALGDRSFPLLTRAYGSLGMADLGRFALVFAAGGLVHRYQGRLPCRWSVVGLCAVVVTVTMWLPDYRLVAAPALAYGLVAAGALLRRPRFHITQDISYGMYIYGFPVQQLLVLAGVGAWGVGGLAVAAMILTVPLAAMSWFLVERPAMRVKSVSRPSGR